MSQLPKSGRWQRGRAGGDWSGRRMANQANKTRKRRAVERSFGAGILTFNEPAGCRAERQADERRKHLLLDASIARRRRGFGCTIGVGHLFSVDCRGCELCDRFAWRASPLRPVLGDQRADPPRLTASSSWVVRSFGPQNGLVARVGSKSATCRSEERRVGKE